MTSSICLLPLGNSNTRAMEAGTSNDFKKTISYVVASRKNKLRWQI